MAKKKEALPNCKECVHHHSPYNIGANGEPILCKCYKHPERSWLTKNGGCVDFEKKP